VVCNPFFCRKESAKSDFLSYVFVESYVGFRKMYFCKSLASVTVHNIGNASFLWLGYLRLWMTFSACSKAT
jgi:hypothetical protein